MSNCPQVLCIGSVLWDIIGRGSVHMERGSDKPGRITRLPGGVAMNIAMALRHFGVSPALLTSIGMDDEGRELIAAAEDLGLDMQYAYRPADLPTDRYMAIEGSNGLIAAIADAHSLEAAGNNILTPLTDGRLASRGQKWSGLVALDGNLTSDMLAYIAGSGLFDQADLRIAPASPGKAERLNAILGHPGATVYVNLEEANILLGKACQTSRQAACALQQQGSGRVLVTDGSNPTCAASDQDALMGTPPVVTVKRVTGAGDVFMAAHMAAEIRGQDGRTALTSALAAAAHYISGDHSL